jgi:hypothetical protein
LWQTNQSEDPTRFQRPPCSGSVNHVNRYSNTHDQRTSEPEQGVRRLVSAGMYLLVPVAASLASLTSARNRRERSRHGSSYWRFSHLPRRFPAGWHSAVVVPTSRCCSTSSAQ